MIDQRQLARLLDLQHDGRLNPEQESLLHTMLENPDVALWWGRMLTIEQRLAQSLESRLDAESLSPAARNRIHVQLQRRPAFRRISHVAVRAVLVVVLALCAGGFSLALLTLSDRLNPFRATPTPVLPTPAPSAAPTQTSTPMPSIAPAQTPTPAPSAGPARTPTPAPTLAASPQSPSNQPGFAPLVASPTAAPTRTPRPRTPQPRPTQTPTDTPPTPTPEPTAPLATVEATADPYPAPYPRPEESPSAEPSPEESPPPKPTNPPPEPTEAPPDPYPPPPMFSPTPTPR